MKDNFQSFREFYPFYLSEHKNPVCRLLHFIGTGLIIIVLLGILLTHRWWFLLILPFIGYSFAWVGHFFFEKNRPATFTHPWYSLLGDWVMFGEILLGRRKLRDHGE